MSDSELPRGITEVSWRNKADKRRTIKYRVRVSRKTGKWDELFDTLDEAKKCLAMTKSPDGMLGLTEREARDRQMAQAVANYLHSPGLRHYVMRRYVPRYIGVPSREERKTKTGVESVYIVTLDGKEHEVNPTKWRTVKTNVTRIESILKTVVRWYPPNLRSMSGVLAQFKDAHPDAEQRPLGDFQIEDITRRTATDFIAARLAGAAKPTVRREVGQMQAFYNKLPIIEEGLVLPHGNPFKDADRALLKGHNKKRRRVLTDDEEERLFLALSECRSRGGAGASRTTGRGQANAASEMPMIVALALMTGMRKSEVLFLRWEQVKDTHIELQGDETKSAEERFVVLTEEGKAVLSRIPRRDARLFHYTADGFKSNWKRVVEKAGVKNLRFHDLRRTMISRFVASMASPSATVISEMTGMRHIKHIDGEYIEPIRVQNEIAQGIRTEGALRRTVGHKREQMTSHYTSLIPQTPVAKPASAQNEIVQGTPNEVALSRTVGHESEQMTSPYTSLTPQTPVAKTKRPVSQKARAKAR